MTGERQVRLQLGARTVLAPGGDGHEVLQYAGITVVRIEDGEPVEQTWVPVGTAPNYADDEALIATWHEALQWSRTTPACEAVNAEVQRKPDGRARS